MDRISVLKHLPKISPDWHRIVFDFLYYSLDKKTRKSCIRLFSGKKIYISTPSPEKGLLCQIFGLEVYDPYGVIKPGNTVIDIGANVGVFSVYALGKGAKVISYEPSSENFSRLQENRDINGQNGFTIWKKGVWNKNGNIDFYLTDNPANNHFVNSYEKAKTSKCETAQVITFESVLKENSLDSVDFVKIDVEGCELDIMASMDKDLIRKVKHWGIECENQEVVGKIKPILEAANYSFSPTISKWYAHILYATRID
ncbi:MAG: FkbM family methyltransferase [Candidatus Micrarchaeia archaeon]